MKRALLIGINYRGMEGELRGCINDVNNIKNILIENCEFQDKNIRMLTEDIPDFHPTHENITKSIMWLVQDILPGDTLVFYFSGHGIHAPDTNFDEVDGQDEMLVPLDYKTKGLISDDWMFDNMIRKIPPKTTLWAFSDCCHSGTIMDLKYNIQSLCKRERVLPENKSNQYISSEWSDQFNFYIEKKHDVPGDIYLFSGCQDEQVSMDAFLSQKFQGSFTYCLIEIIKNNMIRTTDGKSRFKPNTLKIREVIKEINARLELVGFKGQKSQLSLSNIGHLDRTLDF